MARETLVPGRVVWRCRRGMKELDLVLRRYVDDRWLEADAAERELFERVLDLPDPQLADCLLRREAAPDAGLERMFALLRAG